MTGASAALVVEISLTYPVCQSMPSRSPLPAIASLLALSFFAAGLLLSIGLVSPSHATEDTRENQEYIESIIRQYILDNPEIIEEAIIQLQKREQAARDTTRRQALERHRTAIFNDPFSPISGSAADQAKVTIVEFFDYQCGYCRRSFSALKNTLDNDAGIRVVWKEFPILGPVSIIAAQAAMAARKQGKYLDLHAALMNSKGRLNRDKIFEIAARVGLDLNRLRLDMTDPDISAHFDETRKIADALQINGTPAFIVGNTIVDGALSESQLLELIATAGNGS